MIEKHFLFYDNDLKLLLDLGFYFCILFYSYIPRSIWGPLVPPAPHFEKHQ